MSRYSEAKEIYSKYGIDTDKAIGQLLNIKVSMHCWQGDDVTGFESQNALSGGIAATGNYPYKATNPQQLMADIDKALSLVPGKHRLNLHAIYAIFEDGKTAERDELEPKHFAKWVEFAKERGLGLDFNPTFFSHEKASSLTLSSSNEEIRSFWVRHAVACIKIAQYFAKELGTPSLVNIWIPDGFKDIPADRYTPRANLKKSLDEILAVPYDKSLVYVAVESKVFGLGFESCTVGSHEFYMNYAAKNNILCLLDNGHFHPTENVADKISSMLLFSEKLALHVTRPVRWDSDHVILLDDTLRDIALEVVRAGTDKVLIGLDYFDASINRIAAFVVGMRNMQKALLCALLTPNEQLKQLQKSEQFTQQMIIQEELKTLPFGDVWNEACSIANINANDLFSEIESYEKNILAKRV